MTEEVSHPEHRARRPNQAARARLVSLGVAGAATVGLVAAMALPADGGAATDPADAAVTSGSPGPTAGLGADGSSASAVPSSTLATTPATSSSGS